MSEVVAAVSDVTAVRPLRLTLWRRISQFAFVGILGQWSFYGIFRCPFIVPYVSCQNCPVVTCYGRLLSMFWGFWLLLPVSVLLFGRAFCGWACPGGLANQLLGAVAPLKLRTPSRLLRLLPYGAYLGLIVALYAYFGLGQPRVNVPIRVGDFLGAVPLTFEHAMPLWLWRTGFVLGFLALGLVVSNAWCRFACPTGGLLDAAKGLSFFRVYKTSACNGCGKCQRVCHMGTLPEEHNCTNCGDCLDSCPVGAIGLGRKPLDT